MKVRCFKVHVSALALVVLIFASLMFLSFPFSATSAQSISKDEALEILMNDLMKPSSSFDRVAAYMLSEPLQANDIVSSDFGSNYTINNDTWFIFVDDYPSYMFGHPVRYVFMDAATGSYAIENETWWPSINYMSMWNETLGRGEVIEIYSILGGAVPEPVGNCTGTSPGDYGDAPDGQEAYWGVNGSFPTLFSTNNSKFSRPGAHTLNVGQEMLGASVTKEDCATDPNDPDNVSNMVDADSDDRIFVMIENTTAKLVFDVTVNAGAPNITRYVNVLIDFDQNGKWSGNVTGKEWAIVNMEVNVAPETNETIITQKFSWWNGSVHPSPVWMRVSLTREKVNETLFSVDGWDGSGQFQYGEIEDFFVFLMAHPAMQPAPVLPPEQQQYQQELGLLYPEWWFLWPPMRGNPPDGQPLNQSKPDNKPKPPKAQEPGPRKICCGRIPVTYHALIIQCSDDGFSDLASRKMYDVLKDQKYGVRRLGPRKRKLVDEVTTKNRIQKEIEDIKKNVKCGDRVLIYIIGHGLEKDGTWRKDGKKYPKGSILIERGGKIREVLKQEELKSWLDKIQPCDEKKDKCGDKEKCCKVAVVIEACFSGTFIDLSDPKKGIDGKGRIILTSSGAGQPSDGKPWYTIGFVKDLRDKNADTKGGGKDGKKPDGYVDVDEAHASAKDQVKRARAEGQDPEDNDQRCDCKCPPCQKPSDPSGTEKYIFPECNPVYVIGDWYPANTTLPIYVVLNTTWIDGMTIPARVPETATSVTTNGTGQIPPTKIWASAVTGAYDIIVDLNNDGLYNATIDALADNNIDGAGFIVTKTAHSPIASFSEDPETPYEDQPVTFDASTSQPGFDGANTCPITRYYWDFGDGATANETDPITHHAYHAAGTFIVTLTVYAPPSPYACPTYNPKHTTTHVKNVISEAVGGHMILPRIDKPHPLAPNILPAFLIAAVSTAITAASIATIYKGKRKARKPQQ
jgi:hypothetical protein